MKQLILDKNIISDVAIGSMLKRPWHYGLMLVSFDFHSISPMSIFKISDWLINGKTTTHFPMEGLSYYYEFFPLDMELKKYTDVPFVYEPINYN